MAEVGLGPCTQCGQAHAEGAACPAPERTSETSLPVDQRLGQILDGRYLLTRVLGRGGYGTVFEAERVTDRGFVAVKVIHKVESQAMERLEQEARIASALHHPNICQVSDIGRLENGSPYLVMEKLVGRNLGDQLRRTGPLPLGLATDLMMQVLAALVMAHAHGVTHRDLKPQNIFLVREGGAVKVKLLDFGLAKVRNGPRLTAPNVALGTLAYMSPEQLRSEEVDGRSDLFSCGIILFESLTGHLPWTGSDRVARIRAVFRDPPRTLSSFRPELPSSLETVVARALERKPADRYRSAGELLAALRPHLLVADAFDVPDLDTPDIPGFVLPVLPRLFDSESGSY